MKLGRLILRLIVGGYFFGHGTQKLFGWFGGHGPEGTGQFFESIGLRPGKRHALAAGAAEAGGGALLVVGAATPRRRLGADRHDAHRHQPRPPQERPLGHRPGL